ncbi:hypothetical protein [Anaeromicropila populeti]|uniref:Uncharacterized protein n=1 Tax=Anaeromicropila populeti TaxID=37658 RepID=A0A1I6IDT1_9FIRM|nr:hypothetical protein [Anaeromicropila populeti]SFR64779.1 hypothetical protein SAMN05661086_00729 [Anaeromicropila populeti]
MANTATYKIGNIEKGNIMFWSVCTQCGSHGVVTLKDDQQTYFTAKKDTDDWNLQSLAQAYAIYQGGDNLRLEVEVTYPNADIEQSINSYNITDPSSNIVGYGYNYCIEDSTDNDYNDYYIDLVAWRKKG